jgi:hypothetical protein
LRQGDGETEEQGEKERGTPGNEDEQGQHPHILLIKGGVSMVTPNLVGFVAFCCSICRDRATNSLRAAILSIGVDF